LRPPPLTFCEGLGESAYGLGPLLAREPKAHGALDHLEARVRMHLQKEKKAQAKADQAKQRK